MWENIPYMKHDSWTPRSLRGICGLVAERDWWCPYTTWAKTLTGMVEQIWVFYNRLDIFKAPFTVCINGSCSCQVLEGQYQAVRIVLGVQVRKYSKPNLVAFHCWLVGGKQNPTYIWAIGIDMYWLQASSSLSKNTCPLYHHFSVMWWARLVTVSDPNHKTKKFGGLDF